MTRGVRAHLLVSGAFCRAARISNYGRSDALHLCKGFFNAPKAARAKDCGLRTHLRILLFKNQRCRIDAKAQSGGSRTIEKDMTKGGAATHAVNFIAHHAVA